MIHELDRPYFLYAPLLLAIVRIAKCDELWEWLRMLFDMAMSCVICTLTTVTFFIRYNLYRSSHTWKTKRERRSQPDKQVIQAKHNCQWPLQRRMEQRSLRHLYLWILLSIFPINTIQYFNSLLFSWFNGDWHVTRILNVSKP